MAQIASLQASPTIDEFLRVLSRSHTSLNEARMRQAYETALELYAGRRHSTGVTLLEHSLGVLQFFLAFEPDEDAIIACLLHHALETKAISLDELEARFGETVRSIVSGVHLLGHVTTKNRRMTIDHMRLMLLRVSDDVRVVLIVLCKQRFILEHLDTLSREERLEVCRDVLHLFAPVAARLGIYTLKHQLEGLAFPVVYPTDAQRISEQLAEIHERFGHFLEQTSVTLVEFLRREGVSARVEVREKEPYSIFRKMQQKSLTHVQDLYDLFAFRVIVATPMACYQVLGLLHRIGHPVAHRFKDFVAFPKPNGYQSLHTTLAHLPGAPDWVFVEVQVRTEEMHREAEYGIAAHWSYKEGGTAEHAARRALLQKVLSYQQREGAGTGLLTDHIFVLTPKGDVVELPEGATPLDFAFQLHTDVGLSFRAARVNGSIVPLTYQLENGDIVEIQRYRDPRPSPRWITLLKTASARSRLRRYLASQERPAYIASGREQVNAELAQRHLPPLDPDLILLRKVGGRTLDVEEREDLLVKIGQGSERASTLLPRVTALASQFAPPAKRGRTSARIAQGDSDVLADIPMPTRYAKCCKPSRAEGGPIVGVVSRAGEIRVHRAECTMLKGVNPERRVRVRWI